MRFGNSSVALLRDTFRRAAIQALGKCEETHPGHYQNRYCSLVNASWAKIGPTVQTIQVNEAELLIRGSWQYTIDLHTEGQFQIAKAQINEFASLLASAVPHGETVKATFDFPPTEISANEEKLTCSFRGVVCVQIPCCVPA